MVLLPIDYYQLGMIMTGFLCVSYVGIFNIFFSKKIHISNIFANILWDTKYFRNLHHFTLIFHFNHSIIFNSLLLYIILW